MALTVSGAVFSWGCNEDGCLGLGAAAHNNATVNLPSLVPSLPSPARHLAAGGCHSAIVIPRGRLLLAGSNAHGQLGVPRADLSCSHEFRELCPSHKLFVRSVTLGNEHTLLLTYTGELYAFGRNAEGQCGVGADGTKCVEVPSRVPLPTPVGVDISKGMVVWAVAAGRDHNVVLCSLSTEPADSPRFQDETLARTSPASTSSPHRRQRCATGSVESFARLKQVSSLLEQTAQCEAQSAQSTARLNSSMLSVPSCGDCEQSPEQVKRGSLPPWVLFRPIVQPGAAPRTFTTLGVPRLAILFAEAVASHSPSQVLARTELQRILTIIFARPSMLNASFCYPGLSTARLDAASLCRMLATLCARIEGLGPALLEAAAEGLKVLAKGPTEDLTQRDQLRAVAIYMCLPPHRPVSTAGGRSSRPMLNSIAHLVMRMSGTGRRTLRDLIADECGDVRVLRDFLVPHVRSLADDAIRNAGQQPWLSGPLWEVVAQLQLQRTLWEAVLLLQVLASANEKAAHALQEDFAATAADSNSANATKQTSVESFDSHQPSNASGEVSLASSVPPISGTHRIVGSLLDPSAFQLASLAEGSIPPEVEFWLFQEHAQFHQITPTDVVDEPLWSDAAGMLPRRFCSFMAHANLVPVAFKQRVLQVENVLRQRLSQEQVLWPQAEMVLGGGRADPTAFYFMLNVRRQDLLKDTFAQMYSANPVDLRRPLRVEFTGEEAVDEGGVMREFFRLLSQELFAPDAGLFYEVEDSRRLWFNSVLRPGRQLEDYKMLGVIVALAVYNNHPGLDVALPTALFKKLKEQPTTQEDLAQLFPSFARSLDAILSWTPSQPAVSPEGIEAANEEFMNTFCLTYVLSPPQESVHVPGSANSDGGGAAASATTMATPSAEMPLCEGGADRPVLYSDKEDFVELAHKYLLHTSVRPQFECFSRGFRRVCNSPLFDVLSPSELEAIVAGDRDFDFARLRQGVQYEGFAPDEPFIENLWTVLEGFSLHRRRRFLAFCTGSDVAPAGGLQDLHLLVQRHGDEPTMRLPVAHTCFNLLLLPRYSSLEKLRTMLITAIEWTEGFGLQ